VGNIDPLLLQQSAIQMPVLNETQNKHVTRNKHRIS